LVDIIEAELMAHTETTKRDSKGIAGRRNARAPKQSDAEPSKHRETGTAKLFMHGRSQAVRLPKEFRFPGKEVRVRRMGNGVLLEPMEFDVEAWFKRLDSYGDVPFMPEGREQPEMPPDEPGDSFDE
jgi:antitoxin VapB